MPQPTRDPFSIRQKRIDWCIPAAVEFVGAVSGHYNVEQEQLIRESVNRYKEFPGTFGQAARILKDLVPGIEVDTPNSVDFEDWKRQVEQAVAGGKHVVTSTANEDLYRNPTTGALEQTWHMRVVLSCDPDGLEVFNPAKGSERITWDWVRRMRETRPGGTDLLVIS